MTRHRTDGFYGRTGKRIVDIMLAGPALVVLLPLMTVIALAVVVVSGRPVFFAQERVGRFGRRFRILKFRTMVRDAEAAGSVTVSRDPRVTGVGKVLRQWKLDELPQLWNVLRGEMSLVGPRADVPEVVNQLSGSDLVILELRPGITGPATIAYRNEEELLAAQVDPEKFNTEVVFPDKVRINRAYVEELSLGTDMRCLVETFSAVFGRNDGPLH